MEGRPLSSAFLSGYGESKNTKDTFVHGANAKLLFLSHKLIRKLIRIKRREELEFFFFQSIEFLARFCDVLTIPCCTYRTERAEATFSPACWRYCNIQEECPFNPMLVNLGKFFVRGAEFPLIRGIKNWRERVVEARYWVVRSIIEAIAPRWNVDRYRRLSIWERLGNFLCAVTTANHIMQG